MAIALLGWAGERTSPGRSAPCVGPLAAPIAAAGAGVGAAAFGLGPLFLFFLKVGSVLFGSGYVLLAFLRADLVTRWGWLTEGQLIDAVAVGQVTPGPLFTTATFIGYVLGGLRGGLVATLGSSISRRRASRWRAACCCCDMGSTRRGWCSSGRQWESSLASESLDLPALLPRQPGLA